MKKVYVENFKSSAVCSLLILEMRSDKARKNTLPLMSLGL